MQTFKQKKNNLLSGTAVYLISNILNAAIPFILLPILTRYLSPEQFGEIAMFQALMGALTAFIGLSMHGAAGRKFYDGQLEKDDLRDFIGACLQILLITTSLTLIVLVSTSSLLKEWVGLDQRWILLAVLVSAGSMIIQLRLVQWQVRKQALLYCMMQVSQSLFNLLLSLAFVVFLALGADGRISAQVCAAGIFAILSLWLLKRDGLMKFAIWRPNYIREVLSFGVPLIPHVCGMFLLSSVDRFVINSELGLAQAGIYMVAAQLGMGLSIIFDAVNKAFVPWLFERLKRDDDDEKQMIVRLTYAWYLLILFGAGIAFLIGPWLVTIVAGSEYEKAGELIGWLVLGQVFGGMYLMITNYIFYSKKTGLLSLVTILSGFINVVLLLFLIKKFGLNGVAYAFCISMAIRFLLSWLVAQKLHTMPWFEFKKIFLLG